MSDGNTIFTRAAEARNIVGFIGMFRSVHDDEFMSAIEQVNAAAGMISAALGYRP